jgi:hypothetical protein
MLHRPEPRKFLCPLHSSIASDQATKALSNKRTTANCSCSSTDGSVIKSLRYLARKEGGLDVSLKAMLLLLHVIVPTMALQPHSLRLEVAAVQQQLRLLCWFTPTGEFMLQQLLNRDGMYKLSQLSVSVCFALRVTCLYLFPYMLPKVFIQSIGHVSLVLQLAVSRNRYGAAKPR